jgi:hypothetical protein
VALYNQPLFIRDDRHAVAAAATTNLQSASSSPPLSSLLSVTKSKAKSTKTTVKAVNQNQSDMP